jgi:hypothetical protein
MIIDGLVVVIALGAVDEKAIDSLAHIPFYPFPEGLFILPLIRLGFNGQRETVDLDRTG